MRSPILSRPQLAAGFLCLLSMLLASCASDDRPRRGAMPKPPAPVAGEATFFTERLVASVRVGMEFSRPEGGDSGPHSERGGGGHRGGGGVSVGGGAGPAHFGHGTGGRGGGPHGGGGDGPREDMEGRDGGPRVVPANGVPLMIRLKLRNTGAAPLEVACRDFASALGNFVVQPATLTVPAGEAAEFSPMTSFVQGDLPDELPVTVTLRIAGKTEKQVVVLRPVPRETPPPAVER